MTAMIDVSSYQTVELNFALNVDVQFALQSGDLPSAEKIKSWANKAYQMVAPLRGLATENEVTIRICGNDEITELNRDYRGKDKPTNVLSFPFEVPEGVDLALLGDIVICHDVVLAEAEAEIKASDQHYAHMVTHGVLHLCGYDHECDQSAEEMENLEVQALALSDVPNPYQMT